MSYNHGYDCNHINGILDITDTEIGVRQVFLKWALRARWIDEQKNSHLNFALVNHFNNSHLYFAQVFTLLSHFELRNKSHKNNNAINRLNEVSY